MKAILDTGLEQYLFDDVRQAAQCAHLLKGAELIDYDTKRNKHVPLPKTRRIGRKVEVRSVDDSWLDQDAFDKAKHGTFEPFQGFALVELLCVLAIVAILSALLMPAVSRAVRHTRASIENTRQFQSQRLAAAWDGDTTNQVFSVSSYNEMTNTTEIP